MVSYIVIFFITALKEGSSDFIIFFLKYLTGYTYKTVPSFDRQINCNQKRLKSVLVLTRKRTLRYKNEKNNGTV